MPRKALKRPPRLPKAVRTITVSPVGLPQTVEGFLAILGYAYKLGRKDAIASLAKKGMKP